MRIKRIMIHHDDIQELGEVAVDYMGKEYICVTDEMIVIGKESFRLRTSSSQWDMVVLKKIGRKIQIDIVGTAGGIGLLNISWWSESSFVKSMDQFFVNRCKLRGWRIEEVA